MNSSEIRVLKAIRSGGPVSRRDLPERTGLSAGAITQITADLLRRGFITEKKDELRQSGRPRVFLEIREDGPIVLGATMTEAGALRVAFVDLSGNIRFGAELPTGIGVNTVNSFERLVDGVADTLAAAIEDSGYSRSDIEHVGIALPALVDSARGIIHFMATFPQEPFPFASVVAQRLGLPVTLENHISGMARAEHWFGRAKAVDTFMLIHIGPAIGSAQYFNGMPRTGAHGINPQIAHVKTGHGRDAPQCYCGARGCATAYASVYGMVQQAGLIDGFHHPVTELNRRFGLLLDRAEAGEEEMRAVIECGAAHLALLLSNLVIANDPGEILVVAPDTRYIEMIQERFGEIFDRNMIPGVAALTHVRFAVVNEDWESKGAAALAFERSAVSRS